MKLEIQFAEETRFDLPIRRASRTTTASFLCLVHRAWPRTASLRSHLRKIVVRHGNAIKIPEGFQTDTGFHFGVDLPK
jgi:lysine/ornithine N-monooxygenase